MDVRFILWSQSNATIGWVQRVKSSETFNCPNILPDERGVNYIPTNWTKVDI